MRVTPGAWGLVTILGGTHKGRIGLYDDDDENGRRGIIYFGDMDYVRHYFFVPHRFLGEITTADLMGRRAAINVAIGFAGRRVADDQRADLLAELLLIDGALADRLIRSQLTEPAVACRIFISYSSKDKQFAKWLAVDLANAGHSVWLDEWRIRVGESIPTRVAEGIEHCDTLVVVLSDHAVKSHWVENEWQAKYMAELKDGKVRVLPALLQECEVPTLLRPKKYADFTDQWSEGLEELLVALRN
jgi:hypothetical protein